MGFGTDTFYIKGDTIKFIHFANDRIKVLISENDINVLGKFSRYNPQHTYYVPGIYIVTLNIENGGCSSFPGKEVTVNNASKNIEDEKFVISAEKEDFAV